MKIKGLNKNLIYAGIIAILATTLAVSSTYAWLGVSRVPYVSDVGVSVIVDNALMIAPDVNGKPGEWDSTLDASEFLSDIVPLKPVTYLPEGFQKITYDNTGRTSGVVPVEEANINVRYNGATSLEAKKAIADQGYMVRMDFWMKCEGANASIHLAEATETADGQMGAGTYVVGAPVWDAKMLSHRNGGHGAEASIRFGFKCVPTDLEGNPVNGEGQFIMYEPNSNIHYDGSTDYKVTESVKGGELIPRSQMIIQDAASWNEKDPIVQDEVIYNAGRFTQNKELFKLEPKMMMKVSLYIWMEGQDYDCIAKAVADGVNISSHLQFGVNADEKQTSIERGNFIDHDRDFEITRN